MTVGIRLLLDEDKRELQRRAARKLVHPPLPAVAVAREGRLGLGPLGVADPDAVAALGQRLGEERRRLLQVRRNHADDDELALVGATGGGDERAGG